MDLSSSHEHGYVLLGQGKEVTVGRFLLSCRDMCVQVSVQVFSHARGGHSLGVVSQVLSVISFDRIFHWPGAQQKDKASFPASPRNLPVSTFPAPGLQASTTLSMGPEDQI